MATIARAVVSGLVAVGLIACGDDPAGPPDAVAPIDAAIDAAVPDAAVPDAAVPDAAVPDAAIDAAIPDAPIDALVIDATPIDGAPIDPLPPLAFDPSYSDDGSLRFAGAGFPGAITSSGPWLGMCGLGTHWFDDITYYDNGIVFRTTPGLTQDLYGTVPTLPINGPVTCPATALHADGQSVTAFQYHDGQVRLVRRDLAGALQTPQAPPQAGRVRAMHAAPGGRVIVVFDDAAWLLDGALAPVTSFGVGGRIAFAGPIRFARVAATAAPRLDLVTDTAMRRIDLMTGALDGAFGVGGVATLPAVIPMRGAVARPGGGALIVGVGAGYQVSATGVVTTVTLPGIDAQAVVEDRAGGAYLISHAEFHGVEMTITQIAPNGPASWGTGSVQTLAPPDLCPLYSTPQCQEWFRVAGAAWTDTGRLGIYIELRAYPIFNFFQGHVPQLLVLTR